MSVKKIGKVHIDLKNEVWRLEGGREGSFCVNRRLVDKHPEVKAVRSAMPKVLHKDTPSRRKPNRREEYFSAKDQYDKDLRTALAAIYKEIEQDSHQFPVLMYRDKDYDHHIDWRYCLYRGIVYQFDRPGYTDEQMIEQIEKLEGQKTKSTGGTD